VADTTRGITITDQADREVVIPDEIRRVVSLWPEATCILRALGASDLLVGVDDKAAEHPVLQKVWPEVKNVQVVGTMSSVNAEQLVALRPDLVVVPAQSKRLAEQIARYGLSAACFHPRGKWENFLEEITLVGTCVKRQSEAASLRKFLEEKMAEVTEVVNSVPKSHRPKVYVTFAYDPLRTTPLDSVERAGGVNLAEGDTEIWRSVDMEWLLARNPDIIVQHALGKFDLTKMSGGWPSLKAVKERRIYRVYLGYAGLDPAQYIFQIRQMAALFHNPDTAWAENLKADGERIFGRVYGCTEAFENIVHEMNVTLPIYDDKDTES